MTDLRLALVLHKFFFSCNRSETLVEQQQIRGEDVPMVIMRLKLSKFFFEKVENGRKWKLRNMKKNT